MTDYTVNIKDHAYRVKINRDDAWLDNRPMRQELIQLNQGGLHLMRHGNSVKELHLEPWSDDTYEVLYEGRRLIVNVDNGKTRKKPRQVQDSSKLLTAPMPGLVIEIPVRLGQNVEKGDVLLVLESMKMQMQLKAETSGSVCEINVVTGSQVEKGCILIKLD